MTRFIHTLHFFFKRLALGLVFQMALAASSTAHEQHIQAIFTNWEPYGYLEDGVASGFEIEIFQAVAETLGLNVAFTECPWQRCLSMIRNGHSDALISALVTPERLAYMHFSSEPISKSETAFFVRSTKVIEFNGDYNALAGLSIGVTRGFSYGAEFDNTPGLKLDDASTTEQVLKKLLLYRNDIAIGNILVISSIAKKMGRLDDIRFLQPRVHEKDLYVAFSKTDRLKAFSATFSSALKSFKETQAYFQIGLKYGLNRGAE